MHIERWIYENYKKMLVSVTGAFLIVEIVPQTQIMWVLIGAVYVALLNNLVRLWEKRA